MTRLAIVLSTAAGAGRMPVAPGTAGSAVGLLLYALLVRAAPDWGVPLAVLVLVPAGVWASAIGVRHFGGPDPRPVVIDEVAGMLLALAWTPIGVRAAVVGFLLFRLFDIVKPFPAGRLERLHGGVGVMADDLVAGLYANVALRAVVWAAPHWMR
ncbi:MAG TPA: phosphatidylglycerophosphatase A [Vicinamibacterales bacterium]|nr:phosphatidylglycerophosphatase A [Vicinamibacterales bacterium]